MTAKGLFNRCFTVRSHLCSTCGQACSLACCLIQNFLGYRLNISSAGSVRQHWGTWWWDAACREPCFCWSRAWVQQQDGVVCKWEKTPNPEQLLVQGSLLMILLAEHGECWAYGALNTHENPGLMPSVNSWWRTRDLILVWGTAGFPVSSWTVVTIIAMCHDSRGSWSGK